jgi:hypothetical protein
VNIKEVPCHAFIVQSDFPENVGMVVEVRERVSLEGMEAHVFWRIISSDPMSLMYPGEICDEYKQGYQAVCLDSALRPIGGVPVNDWEQLYNTEPEMDSVHFKSEVS